MHACGVVAVSATASIASHRCSLATIPGVSFSRLTNGSEARRWSTTGSPQVIE